MSNPKEKPDAVRLSLGTWITAMLMLLTMAGMLGTLALFSFETKTDAAVQAGELKSHVVLAKEKFKGVTEVKTDVKAMQQAIGNVRENVIILMNSRGLRRKIEPLADDVAEAIRPAPLPKPTEDP